MATVALGSSAPSHLCSPLSSAAPSWWSSAVTMHVARPKSAKGRRRPSLGGSQNLGTCPCRVPPSPPPAPHPSATSRRAPAFLPGHVAAEGIPELLQHVPLRSSSSLNKYRVLPSIGWRAAEGAEPEHSDPLKAAEGREEAQKLQTPSGERGPTSEASESAVGSWHLPCPGEEPGGKPGPESPSASAPGAGELPREESRLLLAVRSPSGQRFQQLFKASDSLQQVLAVAEQKMLADYKRCSVETMEVPRRSFSDLTRSLQECGILHKSVLCIRRAAEQRDADLEGSRGMFC